MVCVDHNVFLWIITCMKPIKRHLVTKLEICTIQHLSCSLFGIFGLCRSFLIHFKDTVYFCITNNFGTMFGHHLISSSKPVERHWFILPCKFHLWWQMLILFYFQLQAPASNLWRYPKEQLLGGITCPSPVQVISQHLGHVSRTVGQPAGSSRWPLLCRSESFEQSVCLLCGCFFFFFDKLKHVHLCRQRYRPTGCFKTLKNLTRQEPRYCSQVSSMQCVTSEDVFPQCITTGVTHSKYIIQKLIYLNHRLQCD